MFCWNGCRKSCVPCLQKKGGLWSLLYVRSDKCRWQYIWNWDIYCSPLWIMCRGFVVIVVREWPTPRRSRNRCLFHYTCSLEKWLIIFNSFTRSLLSGNFFYHWKFPKVNANIMLFSLQGLLITSNLVCIYL